MKNTVFSSIALLLMLNFVCSLRAAEPAPVRIAGGALKTVLVISDEPVPYVFPYWGGQGILQRFLKLITGVQPPIVKAGALKPEASDFQIWIGRQPRLEQVMGEELRQLDDDGFIIRLEDNNLYIAGKHNWGTHFAVYYLLERFANCGWYGPEPRFWMPGEDGEVGLFDHIPQAAAVLLPAGLNLTVEPSYKMRWLRHLPRHSGMMRYRDKFHHNFVNIIPPERYGTANPEYFPEIDGQRQVPPANRKYQFQPCVANPDVLQITVDSVLEHFRKVPASDSFSLGMNDSNRFCECAACLAPAPAGLTDKRERIAWAWLDFYNRVAERVAPEFPGKRLGFLAYAYLRVAPEGIELHPSLVPYLTRDSAQHFDPLQFENFERITVKWAAISQQMGIYEYVYGGGFMIPRIYNRYLLPNIRERYRCNADGFYAEDYPNWGLDGPKYWLISKLLWDTALEPEALQREYYTNLFGPVAELIRAYFDHLEEVWCTQTLESKRGNYRWYRDEKQLEIFTPAAAAAAWTLLEQAEAKIAALLLLPEPAEPKERLELIRRRIEFVRDSFAVTKTLSERYHASLQLETLLAAENLDYPTVLATLQLWNRTPLREVYERAAALAIPGGNAIYLPASFREFAQLWARHSAAPLAIDRIVKTAVTEAAPRARKATAAGIRQELAAEFATFTTPETTAAVSLLLELAREYGFFFIRRIETVSAPPVIDSEISTATWGAPVFSGRFFEEFTLEPEPFKSSVWAVTDGKSLFLAFDFAGDPGLIGADVAGKNTDEGVYPKMVHDDAVAITLKAADGAWTTFRINANGAFQEGRGIEAVQVRAARHENGWRAAAELKLPALLAPASLEKNPVSVSVARYRRELAADGKRTLVTCSTNYPLPRELPQSGVIGHGNHVRCMVFVSGPAAVLQQSQPVATETERKE